MPNVPKMPLQRWPKYCTMRVLAAPKKRLLSSKRSSIAGQSSWQKYRKPRLLGWGGVKEINVADYVKRQFVTYIIFYLFVSVLSLCLIKIQLHSLYQIGTA